MQFAFQPKANNLIETSARKFGTYEYLEKILAWFGDHNLDWRNARGCGGLQRRRTESVGIRVAQLG